MLVTKQLLIISVALIALTSAASSPPNVVVIIADDLGSADVSYNFRRNYPTKTPPILSPNIDRLANTSIRLSHYYVHATCTPTRVALLTGRYSHNAGFPGVTVGTNPMGISDKYTTIAQAFKQNDYATHMIGKWHLGFAATVHTPLGKGFDTFLGIYNGGVGYYSKIAGPQFDLVNQTTNFFTPEHTTSLFTGEAVRLIDLHGQDDKPFFLILSYNAAHTPLYPEPQHVAKCQHILNSDRRDYCGLVVGLDEGVGNVTKALERHNLLENTIIIFTTDNGGMPFVGGHNYPLRGGKVTMYEGGSRGIGFIRDPIHTPNGYDYDGLVHVSDWFPTLLSLAGLPNDVQSIEGHDLSQALLNNATSPRTEVVLSLDDLYAHTNRSAYRDLEYKIIFGEAGDDAVYNEPTSGWLNGYNTWVDRVAEVFGYILDYFYGKDQTMLFKVIVDHTRADLNAALGVGRKQKGLYLFHIASDPYEEHDLAPTRPDLVQKYMAILQQKRKERLPYHDWMVYIELPERPGNVVDGRKFWAVWLDEKALNELGDDWEKLGPLANFIYDYFIPTLVRQVILPLLVLVVVLGALIITAALYALGCFSKRPQAKKQKLQ